MTAWLSGLNPEQREAVEHFTGPALILAGAGSGKTRVLTSRVAHLILDHGVAPQAILCVTFTNKAAGEMRARIRRYLGGDPAGMWCGTFHSVGARILRIHGSRIGLDPGFTIYDSDGSLGAVKRAMKEVGVDESRFKPNAVRAHISDAKNRMVSMEEVARLAADPFQRAVAETFPAYQRELERSNSVDFDDLLLGPVRILRDSPDIHELYKNRFQFVLVDEYQDTNRVQYQFLDLIAREHRNLMVVGDDDQSIYGWRGAEVRNILDFERDYPGVHVVRLEQNYRSTQTILDAANSVISRNRDRAGKTLRTDKVGGARIRILECADEQDEAEQIVSLISRQREQGGIEEWRQAAVLFRTNAQSRALEEAARRARMPYRIVAGQRFYERREIQDVIAYLRLIANPRDVDAFQRVVNLPRRGVGDTSQQRVMSLSLATGDSPVQIAAMASHHPGLPKGAAAGLESFATLLSGLRSEADVLTVAELLERVLDRSGYRRMLEDEGAESVDRLDNVNELLNSAMVFDASIDEIRAAEPEESARAVSALQLWLQQTALVAELDSLTADDDAVPMMTLHNAKGLEFPLVIIAGMEDGLFPLARSLVSHEAMEEERRLFYVGVTRAEQQLVLTHARRRRRQAEFLPTVASSYLSDLPDHLLERSKSPRVGAGGSGGRGSWSGGQPRTARRVHDDDFGAGIEPDAEMDQEGVTLRKGMRVRHPTFGGGAVVEVSGSGADLKATINFDTAGTKKVVVRYARLEPDWE